MGNMLGKYALPSKRYGYYNCWSQETRKVEILAETTDGRYVCRYGEGRSLMLIDKKEVKLADEHR